MLNDRACRQAVAFRVSRRAFATANRVALTKMKSGRNLVVGQLPGPHSRRRGKDAGNGRRREKDAISIMTSTVTSWRRRRPQVSIFRGLRTRCEEKLAAVRRQEIELGSDGDDAGRVDRRVAAIIVRIDMREIDGRGDSRVLVEFPGVIPEIGIVDDPPKIAFEMPDIDGIKPHERREQPPIRFGQSIAGRAPRSATRSSRLPTVSKASCRKRRAWTT